MAPIIAVANQKGGVGKTTTAVNVAAFAAVAGREVLVIDLDPQGNATSVLARQPGGRSALDGGQPSPSSLSGVQLVPSSPDLPDQERRILQQHDGRRRFVDGCRSWSESHDLTIIDCPPSLGMLPRLALTVASHLVIPIQCEYYAMEGLGQILAALADLQEDQGHAPQLLGIVLTMRDEDLALSREVEAEVRRHFGSQVCQTVIPRDVSLAAAPSHGRSILDHDPLSPGGVAYLALTKELLDGCQ